MNDGLVPGVYEHYKGKKYLVLGLALHTETEELQVVYVALYETGGTRAFVRPLSMFAESVSIEGREVPRFRYVGPTADSGIVGHSEELEALFS